MNALDPRARISGWPLGFRFLGSAAGGDPVSPAVLALEHLRHDQCRFPIGNPKEAGFGFCGRKAADGRPYCAEHCAVAYIRPGSRDEQREIGQIAAAADRAKPRQIVPHRIMSF